MQVLIVDDDIATVEVIRDKVGWTNLGIDEVYTAYNINSAKLILKEKKVDIIVSDIEMPQGSGLELLQWVREQEIDCEFLLLTCHENFDYAANAISYNAAAYLTKPFNSNVMELALQKMVTKISKNKELQKNSEYGGWLAKNTKLIKLDFWTSLFHGSIPADKIRISDAVKNRKLLLNPEEKFRFILTKVTNFEQEKEKFGGGLFEFILEGFHSEILNSQVENENVIKYLEGNNFYLLTICQEKNSSVLEGHCRSLIRTCSKYFKSSITCCISNLYPLENLAMAKEKVARLVQQNVVYYGQVFLEQDALVNTSDMNQILDLEKITEMLNDKDKTGILNYHKALYEKMTGDKKLSEHVLYLIKQEMLQVVYAHLLKKGIHATRLFHDETSIRLSEKASQSTVDMMRWIIYLLERTFQYEEEVQKTSTIIEKINDYIHGHYKEEIGRNEIAAVFYLTPEYLAKLYKRKTGKYLNDYISEYRIEQAKLLLLRKDFRVSDVAEAVGFDNFSYFSTMFKKYVGVTPMEYRRI
ncbi:MAG TPA: response regulator [Mobilitalea sp.]|nr:response regulator [Mobilitalea sp.]